MNCLFEIEHINYAWGFVHNGTLIMPNGELFRYDLSKLHDEHASIQEKLDNSVKIGEISDELMQHLCKIFKNIKPQEFDLKNVGYDGGSTVFRGFLKTNDKWINIELMQIGDWSGKNSNELTDEIVDLLSEIADVNI